jgi:class 3 adenylate cyclase/tetratricopeptide (TPR) repeat protein
MSARRERKVVTVLFADLVGFTSRAESLDPEDVEAILGPYHERLRSELERFGGTVEKFIGDAVMALFGAPLAHEDDPERAVRAALAIRDWADEEGELEVRIGITTGEALVSLDARPETGQGMASGDVVNTAARLQAAAPANGVLVDETTFRATEQTIDYREADPVEAKGKAEPVPVRVPIQARSRLEIDVRRPRAPLVGRRREAAVLADALDRVREERSAQLVTLVGEPGIGKSRLIYELFQRIESDPQLIWWRQGRSLPYGDGVSFWALGEVVKAHAGILDTDPPQAAEEKLVAAVAALEDADWIAGQLRALVGLGGEAELGESRRSEAFAAWLRFFEGLAEQRPLVLVFEDLHWADDGLLEFVDHVVDWASGVPILVVASARPELLERRPDWGGGKRNATTLSLVPLDEEDTGILVEALLNQLRVPAEEKGAILERAGGNPLYAEEFVRMLAERGVSEQVPETLLGVIAARLDGLSPAEKTSLQHAAVVGKTFWLSAVEAMDGVSRRELDERLHGLERKEFVRRERRSAVEADTQYSFLHVLVRDVAYGQIPRGARVDAHARAAAWIESLGRAGDHAEMLAHHYVQALELAKTSGIETESLVGPARRALRDAGDRAAALYAVEAAERFYDAALELWPEDDPERAELLYRRALPAGYHIAGGDPDRLAEARDAMLAAGETDRAAELEVIIAQRFWIEGDRERADVHRRRGEALLGDGPPSRARAWVLARLGSRAHLAGDDDRGLALVSEARDVSEQVGFDEGVSDALAQIGVWRAEAGDAEGVADIERAIELASATGALGTLARVTNSGAVAHQVLGDLERGYEARLECARIVERIGSDSLVRWYQGSLADHRYRRGDWDEAYRNADGYLASVEAGSPSVGSWQVSFVRAEIRLAKGDSAGAIADAEQALATGREIAEVQALGFVRAGCAHVFMTAGDHGRATALADELLESLRRGESMQFAVINLPVFASTAVQLGRGAELEEALAGHPQIRWTEAVQAYVSGDFVQAADILRRAGARADEAEARLRAAEAFIGEGRLEEADEQLERALAFYRSVGATRYAQEGEALLARTA